MTQARLVAALSAAAKADLDAGVVSGNITPAQEATSFAALQAQLNTFVTTPMHVGKGK